MLIGFDGSRAFTKDKTGTENYSYNLLKNLALVDTKNSYLIYLRPEVQVDGKWPDNFKFKTINFPRLWTQIGLAKYSFLDQLDILFIPSHTLPLIKKPGLKTVVTVHDLGAEYLPKAHQLKQRIYLNVMTHHQLKSATHLIAVSNATKKDLIEKVHIKPEKISVIYEGYDNLAFKPLKIDEYNNILNKYDIENNKYFLYVGTIQPRKNLERLIKAYSIFLSTVKKDNPSSPLPKLILVGKKGWLADRIYKLPKELGIEENIKFLGYVSDSELPALYNGAISLIFPSLFEGFGLPILESMACGTPVLTSNISSMKEIADKNANLINPYSIDDIAQGILKLFKDEKYRKILNHKGIAQAKKFSWKRCAEQTLDVFNSLSR